MSLAADCAEAGHWILDCGTRAFWATEKAREIFAYSPNDRLTGVSIDITERRLAEEALRRIEARLAST